MAAPHLCLCGRRPAYRYTRKDGTPRVSGKLRVAHRCPHGLPCVRGTRHGDQHNEPTCPTCRKEWRALTTGLVRRWPVSIPERFSQDHYGRALPCGEYLGEVREGRTVLHRYLCSHAELLEWLSDADLYRDCASSAAGWDCGDGAIGLQSSARATLRRVRQVLDDHQLPAHSSPAYPMKED